MATAASASTRAGAHDVDPEVVAKKSTNVSGVVPTWMASLCRANPLPPLVAPPACTNTKEPAVSSPVVSASLARCQAPALTT